MFDCIKQSTLPNGKVEYILIYQKWFHLLKIYISQTDYTNTHWIYSLISLSNPGKSFEHFYLGKYFRDSYMVLEILKHMALSFRSR